MIIVPVAGSGLPADSEVVPIHVELQTRYDLLAVLLRFYRYFFQQGIGGPDLIWKDDVSTGIWIYDQFPENPTTENTYPLILINVGGIGYNQEFMGNNMTGWTMGQKTITCRHTPAVSIEVRGRNKAEAYRISELCGMIAFIFAPLLKASVGNIDDVSGIFVGPVSPLGSAGPDVGDSPKLFGAQVSFQVSYKASYTTIEGGAFGPNPQPGNDGVSLGGQQRATDGKGFYLFTMADFHLTAQEKTDPSVTSLVSKTIIIQNPPLS